MKRYIIAGILGLVILFAAVAASSYTPEPQNVTVTPAITAPATATTPMTTAPVTTAHVTTTTPMTTTTVPAPTTTPTPTTAPRLTPQAGFALPEIDINSGEYDNEWAFFLINNYNYIPGGYTFSLSPVYEHYMMDSRCADYAILMIEDARAEGIDLMVISAYRTEQRQQENFEALMNEYIGRGYSEKDAESITARQIAYPGASEHNAGLALDILSADWYMYNNSLSDKFDETPEFKWLYENSRRYGFVLRYPKNLTHITGIIYEPWHYRFVGVRRAMELYQTGWCLEELFGELAMRTEE